MSSLSKILKQIERWQADVYRIDEELGIFRAEIETLIAGIDSIKSASVPVVVRPREMPDGAVFPNAVNKRTTGYGYTITQENKIYDSEQAARLCGVNRATLVRWCNDEMGPKHHHPRNTNGTAHRRMVFRKGDLVAWLWRHYMPWVQRPLPRLGQRVLKVSEAARLTGHSVSHIKAGLKAEAIPHLRINNRYLLFMDDIKEWMSEQKHISQGA